MTTLIEYTNAQFPNHVTERTAGDLTLTDHTAVAHVVGADSGLELARRVRRAMPDTGVGAVMVRATDPTVVVEPRRRFRRSARRTHQQRRAPDCTIAVVAAFAATEQQALVAARVMESLDPYEVRMVAADGAWHSPTA